MKQIILGANGAIGIELARELTQYSADITLVSRNPKKVNQTDKLLPLDLTTKENVDKAIKGSDIVYVTIGFPYRTSIWKQNWNSFIRNVVESCIEHKSKLVFFDNVYAIGGDNVNHITEESPFSPTSEKGKIREEVDKIILKNIENGKLKAIIARAPDFFGGTSKENSIIMNLVYERLKKGKKAQWFCAADKVHSYGFVPDLAKGTAILGNTESAFNQIWNLPTSSEKTTGKKWVELFANEMNQKSSLTILPNWLLKTIGIFVPIMKELAEMNYQYDRDYFFDSSKFNKTFDFKPTSNEMAVKQIVEING